MSIVHIQQAMTNFDVAEPQQQHHQQQHIALTHILHWGLNEIVEICFNILLPFIQYV